MIEKSYSSIIIHILEAYGQKTDNSKKHMLAAIIVYLGTWKVNASKEKELQDKLESNSIIHLITDIDFHTSNDLFKCYRVVETMFEIMFRCKY